MIRKLTSCAVVVISILLASGCGKHQTQGALTGAAIGGTLGSALSSDKNNDTGTLFGALIGSYIGSTAGAEKDQAKKEVTHKQEVRELKGEIRELKSEQEKWCPTCHRLVSIKNAKVCPRCGDDLIVMKYCPECRTIFAPSSPYNYCPYCKGGVRLKTR